MQDDSPQNPTPTEPAPAEQPQSTPQPPPSPVTAAKKPNRRKLIFASVIAAVVVFGASAAAYVGIVVPNKPENLLKTSVKNFVNRESITAKGNIGVTGDGASMDVEFNMLHVDQTKKVALIDMNLAVSGIDLPIEMRAVDGNAYVKLGDLSTIKSLASAYGGEEYAPIVDEVDTLVSDQWIEIDKTLLDQATQNAASEAKCTSEETSMKLKAAVAEAVDLAVDSEATFYTITDTANEDIDGVSATKISLSVDKQKLVDYAKQAEELPAAKALMECSDAADPEFTDSGEDATITALNIWVDGSKNIKRIEVKAETGEGSNKATTTMDMTMLKDAPTVTKPEDSVPLMQLLGELQALFGGTGELDDFDTLSNSLSL